MINGGLLFAGIVLRMIGRGLLCGMALGAIYGTCIFPIVGTLYGCFLGGIIGFGLGVVVGVVIGLAVLLFGPRQEAADFYWMVGMCSAIVTTMGAVIGFSMLYPAMPRSQRIDWVYIVYNLFPALLAGIAATWASRGVARWSYEELHRKEKRKRKPKVEYPLDDLLAEYE